MRIYFPAIRFPLGRKKKFLLFLITWAIRDLLRHCKYICSRYMNWRPQNARMRARSLGAVGWSCDRRSLYYIVCDYIFSIPHIHTFNGAWSISTARATASSRRHSLTLCNIYFSRPTIILCTMYAMRTAERESDDGRWWPSGCIILWETRRLDSFVGPICGLSVCECAYSLVHNMTIE